MILADINFKWKFDYEMSPEEQTFHEQFISVFESKFSCWLQNCGVNSNYRVTFEINYYPHIRKFYFIKISRHEYNILSALKLNRTFYKEYIIDSISL
jgi:hypothetical protein